jgi:hypothetical protein
MFWSGCTGAAYPSGRLDQPLLEVLIDWISKARFDRSFCMEVTSSHNSAYELAMF